MTLPLKISMLVSMRSLFSLFVFATCHLTSLFSPIPCFAKLPGSDELLIAAKGRMLDRKPEIRKAAMTGLAQVLTRPSIPTL